MRHGCKLEQITTSAIGLKWVISAVCGVLSLRLLQAHSASGESSHTALVIVPRSFGELLVNRSDPCHHQRLVSLPPACLVDVLPGFGSNEVLYVIKQRRSTRITIYCYKNNILTLRLWLNVQLYCIWQHWFLRQYYYRFHLFNRKPKALWGSVLGFKEIRNLANNLARCSIQILGALR